MHTCNPYDYSKAYSHSELLTLESGVNDPCLIGCSLLSLVIIRRQRIIKVPHDDYKCHSCLVRRRPLVTSGGRGGFKWHHPAHHQLLTLQRPNFSICCNVKTNKKSTFLRRNCDSLNMLEENPSEEMMCANPI